jgi:hypothetical protein
MLNMILKRSKIDTFVLRFPFDPFLDLVQVNIT